MDFKDFTTRDERLISPFEASKHTRKSDLKMFLWAIPVIALMYVLFVMIKAL